MDDLLIDLAASMADVIGLRGAGFVQQTIRKCLKRHWVISDFAWQAGCTFEQYALAIKWLLVQSIPMPTIC